MINRSFFGYLHFNCDDNFKLISVLTHTDIQNLIHTFLDNIKLLTYNLFLRPFVKNNENDFKYERLHEFSKVLKDYDIICNQECFVGLTTFKQELLSMASKAGFKHYSLSKSPSFWDPYVIDSGLWILSRFPIVETDEITYSLTVKECALGKKGAIYSKIEIWGKLIYETKPDSLITQVRIKAILTNFIILLSNSCKIGGYLHLFNTHLQANYYDNFEIFKACIDCQLHQLVELSEFIALKTKDIPKSDRMKQEEFFYLTQKILKLFDMLKVIFYI